MSDSNRTIIHSGSVAFEPVGYQADAASSLTTDDRLFLKSILRLCANFILVTALLPYLSPFPLSNLDVQPLAFILCAVISIVLFAFAPRVVALKRTDFGILCLGLLCLVYVKPALVARDWEAALRGCAPIILGFPVYIAVRSLYRYMSPRMFLGVVALYCGVIFCQILLPNVYELLFSHFLSDARFFADEGRGPNGLCTEPSMMGNMCLLFIVSIYCFHPDHWAAHRRSAAAIIVLSLVMLVVTKSGTGVVLAMGVALAALLSGRFRYSVKFLILLTMFVSTLAFGIILRNSDARGGKILASLADNPVSVLQEYSLAERCLSTFVGLYQLPEAPLGSGELKIDLDLTNRALNGDAASTIWPDPELRSLLFGLRVVHDNNTGVGSMIQRMGLVGVFIVFALLSTIRGFGGKWVVRTFVVGLLLNASLFIPTLWFLIGSCVAIRNAGKIVSEPRLTSNAARCSEA